MEFHTDEEKALLESFREKGGKRTFFHRHGKLKVDKPTARALSRLIRSGHIERDCSGDFNWICYRLKEPGSRPSKSSATLDPQE